MRAFEFLLEASSDLPSTHFESGAGATFKFERLDPGFDVGDLERWLDSGGP